jgi:hypothetical protein
VGEGAEELCVARGIEETGALAARRERTGQPAAVLEWHRDVGLERAQLGAHCLVGVRVRIALRRIVDGNDAPLGEMAAQRRRHDRLAVGVKERLAGRAEEDAGTGIRIVASTVSRTIAAMRACVQRRHEIAPDAREDARAVVCGAKKDAVEEGLEAGAERIEEEEDREGEDDGKVAVWVIAPALSASVEERHTADVRRADRAREHEIVCGPRFTMASISKRIVAHTIA